MYLALYTIWDGYAPATKYTAYALAVVLALHMVIEKPRWQFLIGYLVSIYQIYNTLNGVPNTGAWIFIGSTLLMVCATLACLMPVAKLPDVTGRYKVIGSMVTTLKNPAAATESQRHGVTVKVFYPAQDATGGRRVHYTTASVIRNLARSLRSFPTWMFQYITLAWAKAMPGVKLSNAEDKWPVVVFSHGLEGHPDVYQILAAEIASHGVIVVLLYHNDGTCLHLKCANHETEFVAIPKQVECVPHEKHLYRNKQLNIRVADFRFVMDVLHSDALADQWGPLARHFDLSRVIAGGHSFGGATAYCASMADDRVRACFTHDLWGEPITLEQRNKKFDRIPVQLMTSERWLIDSTVGPLSQEIAAANKHPKTESVTIKGTRHNNACDVPLFSSVVAMKMGVIGALPVRRGFELINKAIIAFLQRTVLDPTNASAGTRPKDSEYMWLSN